MVLCFSNVVSMTLLLQQAQVCSGDIDRPRPDTIMAPPTGFSRVTDDVVALGSPPTIDILRRFGLGPAHSCAYVAAHGNCSELHPYGDTVLLGMYAKYAQGYDHACRYVGAPYVGWLWCDGDPPTKAAAMVPEALCAHGGYWVPGLMEPLSYDPSGSVMFFRTTCLGQLWLNWPPWRFHHNKCRVLPEFSPYEFLGRHPLPLMMAPRPLVPPQHHKAASDADDAESTTTTYTSSGSGTMAPSWSAPETSTPSTCSMSGGFVVVTSPVVGTSPQTASQDTTTGQTWHTAGRHRVAYILDQRAHIRSHSEWPESQDPIQSHTYPPDLAAPDPPGSVHTGSVHQPDQPDRQLAQQPAEESDSESQASHVSPWNSMANLHVSEDAQDTSGEEFPYFTDLYGELADGGCQ